MEKNPRCLLPKLSIEFAIVFLLASQASSLGQNPNAAVTPAVPSPSIVYERGDVVLPSSRVYVFVGKTGLGHEHAIVGQLKQGNVRLDAPRDAGKLVFDMNTFAADADPARKYIGLDSTTDVSTQRQVNANMLGAAVLDVAHFPTATFTIQTVSALPQVSSRGLPQYQISGDFTLRGVTRPIQVVADAEERDGWVHLRGGFSILQSHFGITPFTKAFGALGVTDQLTIWGDLWLAKERRVAQQSAPPSVK